MDLIHHPKAAYHPLAPSWLLPALLGLDWLGIAHDNSDKRRQKVLWLWPNPAVTQTPKSGEHTKGLVFPLLAPFPKESFGSSRERFF